MKRIYVFLFMGMIILTSACGQVINEDNDKSTDSMNVGNVITETTEPTETIPEETEEDDSDSYSKENGIEFGVFSKMSMDHLMAFYDKETLDEINNSDYHINEKGDANYNIYDIKIWPSEKKGYSTAKLTYTVDVNDLLHSSTETENIEYTINTRQIKLFDYYTGTYIPVNKDHSMIEGNIRKKDPMETNIEYHGKKWNLTAWEEIYDYHNQEYEYDDANHINFTVDFSRVFSLYVTYPNDYDGLSFALRSRGEYTYNKEEMKKQIESAENEDIGKDILSCFDDAGKEDIIFCTMKENGSTKTENVSSAEEAEIPSFEERSGLTEYTDIGSERKFSLPYEFYVFDGNGELLGDAKVKVENGSAEYEITNVSIDSQGDDTNISISYNVNKKLTLDFTNYDGDFSGMAVCQDIKAYDSITGQSIEIKGDYAAENSDWGDWEDDTHIGYKIDYTYNAELTIPTETLDDAVVNFGDRKSPDSVRFKLSDVLSD